MELRVKIDDDNLKRALLAAPEAVSKTLRVELKKQLQEVQQYAKVHHRFTSRTYFLEKSIQQDVDQSGLFGIVKLVLGIAPYGTYVHEGHHSWKADQFLYNALERKKEQIYSAINTAVRTAIKKAGIA